MKFNYSQISSKILRDLPEKQKTIISRRFALNAGQKEKETLQEIGESYGITRERIRQIERDGLLKLKETVKKYEEVFQYFKEYLKKSGGLKKEDLLLKDLGGEKWQNQVYFLLNLEENLERLGETESFYSFWTVNKDSVNKAKEILSSISEELKKIKKPVVYGDLVNLNDSKQKIPISFLEISKKIQRNSEGLWGLKDWPEINPRGVKDKAYLVLKKEKKPLHFKDVASLIPQSLSQTVHNELIKDSRFVLVGRGVYALKEWGYEKGFVKDIILKTLKTAGKPLTKAEVLDKVLKQRLVKENTVLLNLGNKDCFFKTSEGLYKIREA